MKRLFTLLVCLFIPLFIGGLAGGLTAASAGLYQNIALPALSPPGWVFPAVWTLLYTLIGLSSYFAYTSPKGKAKLWRTLYAITLALNFVWPFLFFKWQLYMLSFLVILLMWAVGFVLTREFWVCRPAAGILFLPYMAWLTFAAYLCYGVAMLN